MSTTTQKRRRRILAPLAFAGVAAVGGVALMSGAIFTNTQTVAGNSFTAGSVQLATTPNTSAFSVTNMAPGDVVYKNVNVANTGSLALRYSLTDNLDASGNTGLAAGATPLQMAIKTGLTAAQCNAETGTGDSTWTSGSSVYTGAIAPNGASAANIIGDPTTGQQSGDRALAAGANEDLCVQVTLPFAADNTYQGKAANVDFTFLGEQTTNN